MRDWVMALAGLIVGSAATLATTSFGMDPQGLGEELDRIASRLRRVERECSTHGIARELSALREQHALTAAVAQNDAAQRLEPGQPYEPESSSADGEIERQEPAPAVREQLQLAEQVLDEALIAGIWTQDAAAQLNEAVVGLPPRQHQEVMLALTRALNERRLVAEPGVDSFP